MFIEASFFIEKSLVNYFESIFYFDKPLLYILPVPILPFFSPVGGVCLETD